ncbi:hypothetical protein [Meridianimarinicoccus roseus]|nr:hypothetical protein [Meridianimarinicoccus roseus]
MKIIATLGAATALCLAGGMASAAGVDLSGWVENGNPNNNAGTWTVQGVNSDSVLQSRNGTPTVFFDDGPTGTGTNAQGTQLSGTISVGSSTDDDFIGFVLGYQPNEINSATADFWLIDWKRGQQSGQTAGLALSHVSGNLTSTDTGVNGPWWQHDAPVTEVQRAVNLGTTGYAQNRLYAFDLEFTQNLIEVKVDGIVELSYTAAMNGGTFSNGAFGFYNFSQERVTYAGITQQQAPSIPVPAALPLILSGLGAMGALRLRRRND